jgi:amino acid permease
MPPRGGRGGGGGQGQQQQQQQLREPLLPTAAAAANGDAAAAAAVPPSAAAATAVTVVDAPPSHPYHTSANDADDDELHDDERALVPATASDGSVIYTRRRVRSYAASPLAPAAAAAPADTFWPCTFNIGKVLMGAGMMALPRAFALLGWVCGTVMLLAVGGLTFLTLVGLVKAVELARQQDRQQAGGGGTAPPVRSYGALVRRLLGPRAEAALGMAIVGNCFVLNIVFLVIMGDILVGSKQQQQQQGGSGGGGGGGGIGGGSSGSSFLLSVGAALPPAQTTTTPSSSPPGDVSAAGLIGELTGITSGPLVDRRVVLAALAALALFPLARSRSMDRLRPLNLAGMFSNALFAVLMIVLGVRVAVGGESSGRGPPRIPAWPQWSALAGAAPGAKSYSPLLAGLGFAAVAPVLLNADVCHQSVMPLVPLLKPYSPRRMCGVLGTALLGCNALYLAIAVGGVAAFGTGVDADVLSEVTATSLARLLAGGGGGDHGAGGAALAAAAAAPPAPEKHLAALAAALALLVRVGYLFSLSGSYVLLTYPLRETVGEALLGGHEQTSNHWASVTAALVVATYTFACFLPSIWSALSLVGSATCTVMAFAIPGMVVLATQRQSRKRRAQERAEAVAAAAADGVGAAAAALLGAERMDERAERAEPRRRAREALEAVGAWTAVVLGALLFVNGFVVQFFVKT